MRTLLGALIVAGAVLLPRTAVAAWAAAGNPVFTDVAPQGPIVASAFRDGGILVGAVRGLEVRVQLLTADGVPAPGWPADGVPVSASGLQARLSLSTDAAGAYVGWIDVESRPYAAYLQRVTSSGALAPGWPTGGLLISTAGWDIIPLAPDGTGGVFVIVYDPDGAGAGIKLQHFTAAGV